MKFPRFRELVNWRILIFVQCHLKSDDTVTEHLKTWTKSMIGKQIINQLFRYFRCSLAPEELALCLALMLTLWCLDPPNEDEGLWESEEQIRGSKERTLAAFLLSPESIKESYFLLLQLSRSFCYALSWMKIEKAAEIKILLHTVLEDDCREAIDEDLYRYFGGRMLGKSHAEAVSHDPFPRWY